LPGGEKRGGWQASHHEEWCSNWVVSPHVWTTGLSLIAVWGLSGATPRGQPWTPAGTLSQGRDGLSARRRAVLSPLRAPSLCRYVHRALLRSVWLDLLPIIAATACNQRNYVERYSRYTLSLLSWAGGAAVVHVILGCPSGATVPQGLGIHLRDGTLLVLHGVQSRAERPRHPAGHPHGHHTRSALSLGMRAPSNAPCALRREPHPPGRWGPPFRPERGIEDLLWRPWACLGEGRARLLGRIQGHEPGMRITLRHDG
jgi:hypothetical protein